MKEKFYGNYRAKVLDVSDPLNLGRVKAEVYPMLIGLETAKNLDGVDGMATDSLPWSIPAPPIINGSLGATGVFTVPDLGSFVWVFFEAGDIYQPVYFAAASDGVQGLPIGRTTTTTIIKTATYEILLDRATGTLSITTSGPISIQASDTVTIQASGSVSVESSGAVSIAGSTVELN